MDRTCDLVGLHPVDQRGCDRSLQSGEDGGACGGAGTEAGSVSYRIGRRPITIRSPSAAMHESAVGNALILGTVNICAPGLREQCPICANAAPLWRRGM